MQILSGKSLPRRTFLRGMGAVVALPYLDAMTPALGAFGKRAGSAAATNKTRFVAIELVHGAAGPLSGVTWKPTEWYISSLLSPHPSASGRTARTYLVTVSVLSNLRL